MFDAKTLLLGILMVMCAVYAIMGVGSIVRYWGM